MSKKVNKKKVLVITVGEKKIVNQILNSVNLSFREVCLG